MKKFLFITGGTLATAGIIWCGATWYTGYTIKKQFSPMVSEQIKQFNQNNPLYQITIKSQDYQQGLFSSKVILNLSQSIDANVTNHTALKEDYQFTLYFDHGPFPVSQLKQHQFKPAIMAFSTIIDDISSPLLAQYRQASQDENPIKINGLIDWNKTMTTKMALVPFTHRDADLTITFSGGKVDITNPNIETPDIGYSTLTLPLFEIKGNEENLFRLENLTMNADQKQHEHDIKARAEKVILKFNSASDTQGDININGLTATFYGNEISKEESNFVINYGIDKILANQVDLGSAQLKVGINRAPTQALINWLMSEDFNSQTINTALLQAMTKHQSEVATHFTLTHKDKQKSEVNITFMPSEDSASTIPYIQEGKLNMSLYLPHITAYMMPDNMAKMDPELAKQQQNFMINTILYTVNDFNQRFSMMAGIPSLPLFVTQNQSIKTTIDYNHESVDTLINGQKLGREKLQFIMKMLFNRHYYGLAPSYQ